MKKFLLILLASVSLMISGCLEIEEGIKFNEDGSGTMEIKSDMSELMSMLSMMGAGKGETINKDTVISYKDYLDTAKSLTAPEKDLLRNAEWKIKMNSEEGVFLMTLSAPFKNPGQVNEILAVLQKWDNVDMMGEAMKGLAPGGADPTGGMDLGLDGIGGGNRTTGDMTKDYFNVEWKNGKLSKKLDAAKYKKIGDDKDLNSFKEMGAMAPGGGDILEKITVVSKFVLPRPVKKAEGKNVKLSDDKKTVTISCPVSDIYTDPKNFEYEIEY
jgi:hypothetical protein